MPEKKILIVFGIAFLLLLQAKAQTITQEKVLANTGSAIKALERTKAQLISKLAAAKGWSLKKTGLNGRVAYLTGVDDKGFPLYTSANDNIVSASTIRTNTLWPGGAGLSLNGSSAFMNGKLGLWDEGMPRQTHVELAGRIILKESASVQDHSTHVAGTMIAKGVNPLVKGMAYGTTSLPCYDFNDQLSEMFNAASGLLISNHSYSNIAGWYFNGDESRWEFWGDPGTTEDYKFGYYSYDSQIWDSIAYNAPYYLIVKAAGNSRNENGPPVGEGYWRNNTNGAMEYAGLRPPGISSNDGYDNIPTYGSAKNILTIGAVFPIPSGYSGADEVKSPSFSSWGPSDDGRIKPDVVADGVNVLSSTSGSDNDYTAFSGTSMASPAAAGSAFLLQEYYGKLHAGAFLRSATLKGLIIHTADEAGAAPGPDYQFGWGLMNMQKAAAVIGADNNDHLLLEKSLTNTGNDTVFVINLVASGTGPLTATICWTDPKGRTDFNNAINNQTRKLINDLDIRITSDTDTYLPWILDPANPSRPATTGDNTRDNVEKITINNPVSGGKYRIRVYHKNPLDRAEQAYSLIVSGARITSTGTPGDILFIASPNPSGGRFNLRFVLEERQDLNVSLYNTIGQQVYSKNYPGFTGQFSEDINAEKLSKGLYIIKIMHGKKVYLKKIIIQ